MSSVVASSALLSPSAKETTEVFNQPASPDDGDQENPSSVETTDKSSSSNQRRTSQDINLEEMRAKARLSESELESLDDLAKLKALWREREKFVEVMEAEVVRADERAKDYPRRREQYLMMRLATKESELQDLAGQVSELKAAQKAAATVGLRSTLVDPAVNLMVSNLQKELNETKKKLQDMTEEQAAWKFSAESKTGKQLMSKCRQLLNENEEIGRMISSGRIAKLEGELAMQKNICEEMKRQQLETQDFVTELDEDIEGMQITIHMLQTQLKEAREKLSKYEGGGEQKQTDVKSETPDEDSEKIKPEEKFDEDVEMKNEDEEKAEEENEENEEEEEDFQPRRSGRRAAAAPSTPTKKKGGKRSRTNTPTSENNEDDSSSPAKTRMTRRGRKPAEDDQE